MTRYYYQTETSPKYHPEKGGNKNLHKQGRLHSNSIRKLIGQKCHSDMFTPLQGDTGPEQGRPYQAIPGELLCPEKRKGKNISEDDLGKDYYSHDGDNNNDCYFRNSIDYIAYSLHFSLIKGIMKLFPFQCMRFCQNTPCCAGR